MKWWWPFKRRTPAASAEPPRETCRDGLCKAWSWDACTGGRCKYHCDLYCKCMPVGKPGQLRVILGGRKA